jgi:hypothetical protein
VNRLLGCGSCDGYGRDADMDEFIRQTTTWLHKLHTNDSNDERVRSQLIATRRAYVKLLQSIGRNREADEIKIDTD